MMNDSPLRNNKLRLTIIIFSLITLFVRIYLIDFYKSNSGGVDQNIIYGLQRILEGQPLYQNPEAPPFAIMQYTPLFYHLTAWAGSLAGIGAEDVHQVYMLSKTAALVCNLLTVLIVALTLKLFLRKRSDALLFSLPAFMILTVHYYLRVDSLQLLLFAAGIYATLRYLRSTNALWLMIAALITALCILSKQNGVLLPLLISGYLALVKGKWGAAIGFGLASLAFFGGILHWIIGGDWMSFYQNAYLGLKNGFDYLFPVTIFTSQFFFDLIPWYFLCFIAVAKFIRRPELPVAQHFILFSAIASFFFAVITGLKIGSANNYFTEFLVLMILFLPYLLSHPLSQHQLFRIGRKQVTLKGYAIFCLVVLLASKTVGLFSSVFIERWFKEEQHLYQSATELKNKLEQKGIPQEGEWIYFSRRHFLDNVFFDRTLFPNKDLINIVEEYNPGVYDFSRFTDSMNLGLVSYIITDTEKPGINEQYEYIPFIQFDSTRFDLIDTLGGYRIYKFSGRQQ